MSASIPGSGALTLEQQDRVIEMLGAGKSQGAVAKQLGVTKNVVAGVWRRLGYGPEPTTLYGRCDAMHAKLDAVLKATMGIGRIPEAERTPLRSAGR